MAEKVALSNFDNMDIQLHHIGEKAEIYKPQHTTKNYNLGFKALVSLSATQLIQNHGQHHGLQQ